MTVRQGTASLGTLTWPEAGTSGADCLVIALGSCEQHGPHLPLDTDMRIAETLVSLATEGLRGVVVGPTIGYGASGEHQGFSGTLSIGTDALVAVLVELGRSAIPPFRRLVVVNGHGGNHEALRTAAEVARQEGRALDWWSASVPGGDAHAGRTETSMMLAAHPHLVRMDRLEPGNPTPMTQLLGDLRRDGVLAHSANGVLGDPSDATAEHGWGLLRSLQQQLRAVLRGAGVGEEQPDGP